MVETYVTGGYVQPNWETIVTPTGTYQIQTHNGDISLLNNIQARNTAIAMAMALGVRPDELEEFVLIVRTTLMTPGLTATEVYKSAVEVAFTIAKRRKED